MRFWRALDLGADDGVVGLRGDDAVPGVFKDAEPVRSWKYEVDIEQCRGGPDPLMCERLFVIGPSVSFQCRRYEMKRPAEFQLASTGPAQYNSLARIRWLCNLGL